MPWGCGVHPMTSRCIPLYPSSLPDELGRPTGSNTEEAIQLKNDFQTEPQLISAAQKCGATGESFCYSPNKILLYGAVPNVYALVKGGVPLATSYKFKIA